MTVSKPETVEVTQADIDRVAKAIDAADPGYSIRLTSLVDGESEYTLTVGEEVHKFEWHDDALAMGYRLRLETQARAAIDAMRSTGEPVIWVYQHPEGHRDFRIKRDTANTYEGWIETPLYAHPASFADESHRLNATPSRLREAAQAVLDDRDARSCEIERYVTGGNYGDYWSPAATMVGSEVIARLRAALSDTPPPDNEAEALRGDLMKGLRTSQKTLDEITRQEQANIAGYLALRDFPVGAASALFPPDGVGPNKLGTDLPAIAAQLREISRISGKYDLRECIEGHDDALGDSYTWRDLMDQCDRLASAFNNGGK